MMMMKTSSPKISAKTVRVSTYWVFLVLGMVVYSLELQVSVIFMVWCHVMF